MGGGDNKKNSMRELSSGENSHFHFTPYSHKKSLVNSFFFPLILQREKQKKKRKKEKAQTVNRKHPLAPSLSPPIKQEKGGGRKEKENLALPGNLRLYLHLHQHPFLTEGRDAHARPHRCMVRAPFPESRDCEPQSLGG